MPAERESDALDRITEGKYVFLVSNEAADGRLGQVHSDDGGNQKLGLC